VGKVAGGRRRREYEKAHRNLPFLLSGHCGGPRGYRKGKRYVSKRRVHTGKGAVREMLKIKGGSGTGGALNRHSAVQAKNHLRGITSEKRGVRCGGEKWEQV